METLGRDANVLGLKALGALLHIKLDLLSLLQRSEAGRLDCGLVAENVFAPVVLSDESETLSVVEPLHCTLGHVTALLSKWGVHSASLSPHQRARPHARIGKPRHVQPILPHGLLLSLRHLASADDTRLVEQVARAPLDPNDPSVGGAGQLEGGPLRAPAGGGPRLLAPVFAGRGSA